MCHSLETEIWISIGFIGQALFGLRFFTQWIASERAKKSVVPASFWAISVPAGILLLGYAIWRQDPVFITSEVITLSIFIRNILLLRKHSFHSPEQPEKS